MAEFRTSQRVVERAIAPLIDAGHVVARPGAGLKIATPVQSQAAVYSADCLILYRGSESRLAQTLLIKLGARLRRKGYIVEMKGFDDDAAAVAFLEDKGRVRCCLLQSNFHEVSVGLLAQIKAVSDALVIDGVSVTGIDADAIGTNWREALSIGFRDLQSQGHTRIGFLTSSHEARQIAMARREFLLLSEWAGPDPHPNLYQVPQLPGAYRAEDLRDALPDADGDETAITALIVWGLVDGYLMDAALRQRGLQSGADLSLLLLGSIDVRSEHVSKFDTVGNSDAEKLALFEQVVSARIDGDTAASKTHYLPIYRHVNGSVQLLEATAIP